MVPHIIAELQGYIPSSKIAGSQHSTKGKSEKAKGKEKENVGNEYFILTPCGLFRYIDYWIISDFKPYSYSDLFYSTEFCLRKVIQ